MYIQRDIDPVLSEWKNSSRRKPLLLRGVRQCGKTRTVRHLAEQFENYAEINLEKQPSLHSLFSGDIDAKKIVSRLELETLQPIRPGRTLLFIDEIQACPRAVTAFRYFYEDLPELHVIAAGSLLGVSLGGVAFVFFSCRHPCLGVCSRGCGSRGCGGVLRWFYRFSFS